MKRALILGATQPNSLGRQLVLQMLEDGITPILVGRSAELAAIDPILVGCQFITADLCDPSAPEAILQAAGALDDIAYLVIAGGGPHYRGKFAEQDAASIDAIWGSIVLGPMRLLQLFHAQTSHPYHLSHVGSTSSIRPRDWEFTYASAQVARTVSAENFNTELLQRMGSKNTIFYPGGMKTGLWDESIDTSTFMDPKEVAQIMWNFIVQPDRSNFLKVLIDRAPDGSGTPVVSVL